MEERTVTGVTLGDPSGVGPEVIVKAFAEPALHQESKLFVIGAIEPIERAIAQVGLSQSVRSIKIPSDANSSSEFIDVFELDEIQDTDFPMGVLSEKSARASHAWVAAATHLALAGSVDAITTAPVNKEAWRLAGFSDKGHQEVFQRLTGADYVATMLVSGPLRCVHLSTHLSLLEACEYVKKENVLRV
ncbi:MAG TPA: hypothetical protein EYQ00_13495 [Dehalococcoidia bacterium]|nr:hypothetical protein [Dehalococcoidia bacterium]